MTTTQILDATLKHDVFFTPAELSKRWRGEVSIKTLAQWRSKNQGPPYVKVGGSILYPAADLIIWEQSRLKGLKKESAL